MKEYTTKWLLNASQTTSADGSAVDLGSSPSIAKREVMFILSAHSIGGTAPTTASIKIQESDTSTAGDFADISGAAFTAVNATAGTSQQTIYAPVKKRYVRTVSTFQASADNGTAGEYAVCAVVLQREA